MHLYIALSMTCKFTYIKKDIPGNTNVNNYVITVEAVISSSTNCSLDVVGLFLMQKIIIHV